MKNVIEICRRLTAEEIIIKFEQKMTESSREKEYLKLIRKNELCCGHLRKAFSKKEVEMNKIYFQWSQCGDEKYNKYYKKLIKDLVENIDKYEETYNLFHDEKSKRIFENICNWRISRRSKYLAESFYLSKIQYLEDFEKLTDKEVFVDCGAYDGDSYRELFSYAGGIRKAYLYEADEKNISVACRKNGENASIVYRNVGVGAEKKTLHFNCVGLSSSSFTGDCVGEEVQVVSIDEDIKEKISFLKMDIEGMELEALKGASNHIRSDRPVLAICVYHNITDLWEIPLYIRQLVEETYKFYIRHYTLFHGETVFYAVPQER